MQHRQFVRYIRLTWGFWAKNSSLIAVSTTGKSGRTWIKLLDGLGVVFLCFFNGLHIFFTCVICNCHFKQMIVSILRSSALPCQNKSLKELRIFPKAKSKQNSVSELERWRLHICNKMWEREGKQRRKAKRSFFCFRKLSCDREKKMKWIVVRQRKYESICIRYASVLWA